MEAALAAPQLASATRDWPNGTTLYNSTRGEWDCCCNQTRTAACTQNCSAVNCTAPSNNPFPGCSDCLGQDCTLLALSYLGDGLCDDGTWTLDFNCSEFDYDWGDCCVGADCGPTTTANTTTNTTTDCPVEICGADRHRATVGVAMVAVAAVVLLW